jgi:ribonuclease HII
VLDFTVERGFFTRGLRSVAGVDEAGRGPWAGPVIAAAVVITPDSPWVEGVDDSKLLTRRRREDLAAAIVSTLSYAVGGASVREVDRLNVRVAAALAMRRALARLRTAVDLVVVDGPAMPELGRAHEAMVDGDARCYAVACASIVAKTVRDSLMRRLGARYPEFGWEHNAGYGTPDHRAALDRRGPTPHHRRSFTPVVQRSLF